MASLASLSRKDLLAKVHQFVPPMLDTFHKGQLGRIAVIGGSEDYTGAPYFSAMASAKLGADMSHVICEPGASAVIKTYSPNLMVHPYMRQTKHLNSTDTKDSVASNVTAMLPRVHVLVIGPGLGRDEAMQDTCTAVLKAAREKGLPVVLDADGLLLAQNRPELVTGWREVVLTPNVVEFGRLCKAKGVTVEGGEEGVRARVEELARAYGGVTIIAKGSKDYVSNGDLTLISDGEGGRKRSGGQGDTLTGTIGTLLGWRKAYLDKLWEHDGTLSAEDLLALCAFGGSAITRECSRLAFEQKGRSLQAGDLTEHVHQAFLNVVGEPSSKL
ncbi:YjeF domain-containing protein [Microthyrium microscopicum]|uniref:ATP-dependent (S)-NAD(P)H-hydrate dehydratase n=1 Tax=Microthyrium microscopicum TaxID=703497 RepID=A0A6A6URS4_9PEZI|nr:YjeF domain-containing protein [Microthyrium microscopicum]